MKRAWRSAAQWPPVAYVAMFLLAVLVAVALRHAWTFRGTDVDDAYITYRHARNLAHLHGPVFNPGEHVEGSSTFLFVVVLAVLCVLGISPTDAGPALGVVAFAGLVVLTYATVRLVVRDRSGYLLGLLAAAMVTASTPLAYYSVTGMETTTYAFFVLLGLYLHLRDTLEGGWGRAWPIAFALAALTRPEGALFFGLVLGIGALRPSAEPLPIRSRVQSLLWALAWFAVVFGPVLLFRRAYYGEWVPNSVIAKSGAMDPIRRMPLGDAAKALWEGRGIAMTKEYLERVGLGVSVALLGLVRTRTRYPSALLLAFSTACVAVVVWNEADWFPHYRLLTPAMAPLVVLMAFGMHAAFFAETTRASAVIAAAFSIVVAGYTADRLYFERDYHYPHTQVMNYMKWLGGTLGSVARDDDVLATDMAGVIPYYSDLRTLDVLGLCDAHIAHNGQRYSHMGKTEWEYVFAKRPTYYQFNFPDWVRDMYKNPAFKPYEDDYWAVITPGYLKIHSRDRKLLLVRKDRPDLDELLQALGGTLKDPRDELRRLGMWP